VNIADQIEINLWDISDSLSLQQHDISFSFYKISQAEWAPVSAPVVLRSNCVSWHKSLLKMKMLGLQKMVSDSHLEDCFLVMKWVLHFVRPQEQI
jgi:hypothetical protein